MKIQILWMAVMTVAVGVIPAAAAWAQEKDEVPARATWRPQAPERPDLPPGVERKESNFRVKRPQADLPGFGSSQQEPEPAADTVPAKPAAPVETPAPEAEVQTPVELEPEPAAAPPPDESASTEEPLRESRVESPVKPATIQASASAPAAGHEPPKPIPGSVVQPEYPRDALLSGEEGYVTLEFTVTRRGDVTNIAITEAQPEGVFEQAVRDAIRRWEFQPATENGEAVDQRVRHRFDFNLDE